MIRSNSQIRTPLQIFLSIMICASLWLATAGQAQPAAADPSPPPGFRLMLPLVQSKNESSVSEINTNLDWLNLVNFYRSSAGLPPVTEDPDLSLGDRYHARYAVKNDVLAHTEDPNNPWYTPEGMQASAASNLMANSSADTTDQEAIDSWMQAPFHAVGILDPRLLRVGFGSYRENDGGLQMAAGLDVLRGRGPAPAGIQYPIAWPGDGATIRLTQFFGEAPNPLTSCPGYAAPTGLPILLQAGDGSRTPKITAHSFRSNGQDLEHCIFSETSYNNPNAQQQAVGRSILDSRDAIVLIPRQPLQAGETYTVFITYDGQQYSWSFSVAAP